MNIENAPKGIWYVKRTYGGELGIRTPDTFRYAGFQDRCNRPLYQLSTAKVLCKIPNAKLRANFVGALFILAQKAFANVIRIYVVLKFYCYKILIYSNEFCVLCPP